MNETVTGKWQGPHVVGLLTTLNFGGDPDRNKTQTFQAMIPGSQIGFKEIAGESVLVTARVASGRTPGTCLYFSGIPKILPSSQPPISCSEEGAGNATLSPMMGEECVIVWSHERFVLTKLLTSHASIHVPSSTGLEHGFEVDGLCLTLLSGTDPVLGAYF
ncbi:RGD1560566 (predicted), isoform CRA_c [Rattus norvegicus]|uniref:RGD1560566 (Predicted), isoform CRA_c n=1 Tax=Rattus norvegicus TaxID=10116 RepID=A6I9I2_RAT|nr:RGD1560566 (predicted), isoform CRA_c [Rattus norvegicus]